MCFVEYLFGINWTSLCTALPMLPRHDAELTSRVFNFYYSGRLIGDEKRLSRVLSWCNSKLGGSRLRNFSLPFLLLYQYLPPLDFFFGSMWKLLNHPPSLELIKDENKFLINFAIPITLCKFWLRRPCDAKRRFFNRITTFAKVCYLLLAPQNTSLFVFNLRLHYYRVELKNTKYTSAPTSTNDESGWPQPERLNYARLTR